MKLNYLLFAFALSVALISCDKENDDSEPYVEYTNHISLTGEDNLRDMGGYVNSDGKRVLYRKLFRSGELSALTGADVDSIKSLGIEQVIDLRTDSEVKDQPDVLPYGLAQYRLPLIASLDGATSQKEMFALILSQQITAEQMMLPLYTTIDEIKITNWTAIFDLLETGKTTLWHCTAGKDRAGMTAALVLFSLGVDEETVINDYLVSNTYLSTYIETYVAYLNSAYGNGMGELVRPVFGVEREYIEAFIATIKSKYGTVDAFLGTLGVDRAKMKKYYLEN